MSTAPILKKVDRTLDKADDMLDAAGSKANEVVDDAVDLGHDAINAASKKARKAAQSIDEQESELREDLAARVSDLGNKFQDGKEATMQLFTDIAAGASNLTQRAGRYVRENPGKSFAAVTLLTLVAATAVRRRRRGGKND